MMFIKNLLTTIRDFIYSIIVFILGEYLIAISFSVTLLTALSLLLIDPIASYWSFIHYNKSEKVNFVSEEILKASIEVLIIMSFLYIAKTDGSVIDKFIEVLKIIRTSATKVQETVLKNLNTKGKIK